MHESRASRTDHSHTISHNSLKSRSAQSLHEISTDRLTGNNDYTTMKTTIISQILGASAAAFLFTSCDSKQENMREDALENKADALEDRADAVRDRTEKAADAAEDRADDMKKTSPAAADATEKAADAARTQGEKAADALEDQADKVREQK
jgi:hypothetical protein